MVDGFTNTVLMVILLHHQVLIKKKTIINLYSFLFRLNKRPSLQVEKMVNGKEEVGRGERDVTMVKMLIEMLYLKRNHPRTG